MRGEQGITGSVAYLFGGIGPSPDDHKARQDRREPRCEDHRTTGTASILPISFRKSQRLLNYFSLVTMVGAPQTVAAQELRIESMFPADEETEKEHLRLLGIVSA